MAGLSRFGLAGCLTELASFIKGLPGKKTHVHCLYCATPWCYEASEGVPAGPKRDNPAV